MEPRHCLHNKEEKYHVRQCESPAHCCGSAGSKRGSLIRRDAKQGFHLPFKEDQPALKGGQQCCVAGWQGPPPHRVLLPGWFTTAPAHPGSSGAQTACRSPREATKRFRNLTSQTFLGQGFLNLFCITVGWWILSLTALVLFHHTCRYLVSGS